MCVARDPLLACFLRAQTSKYRSLVESCSSNVVVTSLCCQAAELRKNGKRAKSKIAKEDFMSGLNAATGENEGED